MLIYTSYFSKLKYLPKNIIPISICGKAPEWYKGPQYKKLAPKNEQILSNLDVSHVYQDLYDITKKFVNNLSDSDIRKQHQQLGYPYIVALICYEEPNDFCHRHLVADWLTNNSIKCVEWEFYMK